MYIDPVVCIDCAACEPACPVSAIFYHENVPAKWESYIAKNAVFFKKKK
jgi:ferredoxin